MNRKVIWVLVSTTSKKEAEKIGRAIIEQRLAACYGLYPKLKSVYFWPPKSDRLEESKGPLLVLETLPKHYARITSTVKKMHSDKLPFIGKITVDGIDKSFYNWMAREIH
ncbi:MAG: divalent-cation tolerance protein CutA [Patescibacteria group bacterium]|nr:divalent-cation tolerance protein CutA [Patescibacteria group bacterium]